jgi:hypothetical protein
MLDWPKIIYSVDSVIFGVKFSGSLMRKNDIINYLYEELDNDEGDE